MPKTGSLATEPFCGKPAPILSKQSERGPAAQLLFALVRVPQKLTNKVTPMPFKAAGSLYPAHTHGCLKWQPRRHIRQPKATFCYRVGPCRVPTASLPCRICTAEFGGGTLGHLRVNGGRRAEASAAGASSLTLLCCSPLLGTGHAGYSTIETPGWLAEGLPKVPRNWAHKTKTTRTCLPIFVGG